MDRKLIYKVGYQRLSDSIFLPAIGRARAEEPEGEGPSHANNWPMSHGPVIGITQILSASWQLPAGFAVY
jgi:hypothetical protein